MDYRITEIRPKDEIVKDVHKAILNRPCEILALREGGRGWLLVDVGDVEFGTHRICISTVQHVTGQDGDPEIQIETQNTRYISEAIVLKETASKQSIGLKMQNLSD